jgi:hypothetical protein
MVRAAFAVTLLWFGAAALAPAQSSPLDSLAARLGAARQVRVHSAAGWARLDRPQLAGDSLDFERGRITDRRTGRRSGMASPMPLAPIDRIDLRAGTHAGRGAVIGGLIGAGLGLAAGIALSQDDFVQVGTGTVLAVTLVLSAGGAGLGGLIGAATPRWETVYRAPGAP